MRTFLILVSLVAVNSLYAQEPIDPLHHEDGLSYVLFERERFNTFLGMPHWTLEREYKVSREQFRLLQKLCKARYETQQKDLSELKVGWASADKKERERLIQQLVERDEVQIDQQLEEIQEILTPVQQFGLMREFLRSRSIDLLFDPVATRYLGLTNEDTSQMQVAHRESMKILQAGRLIVPNRFEPMPDEFDEKFRSARARVWSKLPEEKIVRCFQVFGYINQDQDLVDFVEYYPEETKELAAEVDVFRIAELRLAADKKSGKR